MAGFLQEEKKLPVPIESLHLLHALCSRQGKKKEEMVTEISVN